MAQAARKVGFIGLGTQGEPLARNLIVPEVDLMVADVRKEPVKELVAAGARAASGLDELAQHADIIFICVVNDAQVEQIIGGPEGLIGKAKPGAILAIHSTVTPSTIRRLGDRAAAAGLVLIDAPVSGGAQGAAARAMSFMVGGDPAAIDACEPLFRLSGDRITRTGPLGSAAIAKLVHQVVICGNMMAMAEGIRLADAAGLAFEVARKVVSEGAAQSFMADRWGDFDVASVAEPIFYKDLALSLAVAREVGTTLPASALCQQRLAEVLPSKRSEVNS